MSTQEQLDALAREIVDNDVCPELRLQATQLVMGNGNPRADIVFIGEAPGASEDVQGRPFVGDAGEKLNAQLAAIMLSREDVYITNIVKYRPPKNRDPSPQEKQVFLPYLLRELDIIKPKVIVTLGRHSMESFLPDKTITQAHGIPQQVQLGDSEVTVVPFFHPSATIYNKVTRQAFADDFQKLPEIVTRHQ